MPKLKPDEKLIFASMGKLFQITAIFTDDDSANDYLKRHKDEGVIAAPSGGFVFIANLYGNLGRYKLEG